MKSEGVAGVVVMANQPLAFQVSRVAASAAEHGLPTICEWDYMARGGAFSATATISSMRSVASARRSPASSRAPSAEVPVEQSDVWKFTVNLKVATRLGLVIPPSVLARADEVIE